jgi:hypothetical protein
MAKGSSGMTMTVYGPMSLHDYIGYICEYTCIHSNSDAHVHKIQTEMNKYQ